MSEKIAYKGHLPNIHASVFVADGARIIGDVVIGENSSIWFNTVVRGDVNIIRIGSRTNIQDNSVLHVTSDTGPLHIGSKVTVGHNVVLHGCTIEENCLIGMGSIILDGAYIHKNSIVAAGSVVLMNFEVPEGMLAAGVPAKIKRSLTDIEIADINRSAENYVNYGDNYKLK